LLGVRIAVADVPGGPEDGFRATDHTDVIAALRQTAAQKEHYDKLVYLTAAELLAVHDEGAICLDSWPAPRALVELLIRGPISERGNW
jgi:hypothetical protein